jgi:cargo-transport protein YPP1
MLRIEHVQHSLRISAEYSTCHLVRNRLIVAITGLVLTANTELRILKRSNPRPSTSNSQVSELGQLIPTLLSSIETQSHPDGDVLQCQVCLAEIHWLLAEPRLAVSRLPKDIISLLPKILQAGALSDCTTIGILKSTYMRAIYYKQEGNVVGSLEVFRSIVPWMHEHESRLLSQPQMLLWSEQILANMTLTAIIGLELSDRSNKRIDTALQAFRHWAIFGARSKGLTRDEFGIIRPFWKKIEMLKAYYLFLSNLLRHGIDHHALGEKHTRLHQVAEVRRIESTYESELLRVTQFPKAQESNRVIEEWVEQVVRNWEVLCGRTWPESELGEGGRDAYGRNVLDILYRAATKTFHSTLILRRLFQIHKSLADFSLAYKALNSYLELIARGQARAQKSYQRPIGTDDDEIVLRTISEGIEGLCSFGRKDEAEKAFELTGKLEQLTKDYSTRRSEDQANQRTDRDVGQGGLLNRRVDSRTLEIAYRAIGIGKAFWAVWTPFNEQRSRYQNEALASLKQATEVLSGAAPSSETIYAQALLFAETRDLKRAIDCVKKTLSAFELQEGEQDYAQERRIMPLWHLLALLLSARQDFDTAHQMCGAALDQFTDPDILFGRQASINGNVNNDEEKMLLEDSTRGLVDDMDGRERERVIELRMTEIALIELVEGAEEALNGSNELLSLFSCLFGHLGVLKEEKPKARAPVPPKSSAGTVKSLRGSIFGRKRHAASVTPSTQATNGAPSLPENNLTRFPTHTTEAPTIKVTDEESRVKKHKSHSFRRSHSHNRSSSQTHKLHKREGSITSTIRRHSRSAERRPVSSVLSSRQSFETGRERLSPRASTIGAANDVFESDPVEQLGPTSNEDKLTANANTLKSHNSVLEAKVPLPPVAHNTDHREMPPPPGHASQPPQQDVRLPILPSSTTSTQPSPRFPRTAEQIHAHSILVKIWLLVAGLYRRASLFEDSLEACDEAAKSASQIEALVAAQESSAAAFADAGWGGGKSSNEIWADVHAERAHIALAKSMPHDAVKKFEEALMYFLDHPKATVGLSNILLDIYEQKTPSEPPRPGLDLGTLDKQNQRQQQQNIPEQRANAALNQSGAVARQAGDELRKTPENLNRLAARDRAYGLLSNLSKLGSSWDDPEAWYALARAHECSGQIEKAREVLWWCVELEDRRPVRHWRNIGRGSYVL